jgi:hypothetical protein
MRDHRKPQCLGHHLLEDFQALDDEIGLYVRDASHVPTRMGQAPDHPKRDGLRGIDKDDGRRVGDALSRGDADITVDEHDVHASRQRAHD